MPSLLLWDQAATFWINQHHNPVLDALFLNVARLGDWGIAWGLVAGLLLIFGRRRERLLTIIFLAGLFFAELAIMPVIRHCYFRPRPYLEFPGLIRQLGVAWQTSSFPSSHADLWTQATLLYGLAYRRWLGLLIPLSLLTYYARPYLGAHHVLDVVGGIVLGIIIGLAEVAVASRLGLLRRPGSSSPPATDLARSA